MAKQSRRPTRTRRPDPRRRRRHSGPSTKVLQSKASIQPVVNREISSFQSADYMPAIFSYYPQLLEHLPWLSLRGCEKASTPMQLLRSQHLFGQNYMFWKEESLDSDFLPDNLARKLEFIFGDIDIAGSKDRKIIISDYLDGNFGFNAVKLALALEMKPELLLAKGRVTSSSLSRILQLRNQGIKVKLYDRLSQLEWALKRKRFIAKIFPATIMPFAGVSFLSSLAYLSAMLELKQQQDEEGLPGFDFIFVPVDTGLSFLGLELGRRMLKMENTKVIGLTTRHEPSEVSRQIEALGGEFLEYLSLVLKSDLGEKLDAKNFQIISAQSPSIEEALRWTNRFLELESKSLDVFLSGRALMKTVEYVRKNKLENKRILFWNPHVGIPVNELHADIEKLRWPSSIKKWELSPELAALSS